jgi:FKBP-type peptidyl-prolyl cis-trans isomerase FkpA
MNIRNITNAALVGIMILSVSSCMKDDSEAKKAEEKKILEDYISANYSTVTPTASGLYYIETLAGTGDSVKFGEWMELKYTGRLVTSNDVVMTSDLQFAKDNNIYTQGVYYGLSRQVQGYWYEGLNEGISMMREGGKARIIFSSDLGQGGYESKNIPAYSSMIFDIELVKVIPDIKAYENGLLMEYLHEDSISTDSTESGIYFKSKVDGTGDLPATGNVVTVSYKGKFLNGTVFDPGTKPLTLTIGGGSVISGFEAGVKLTKKGGIATFVIPYYYAYGENGYMVYDSNYRIYRTVIPTFTTLVFDIAVTNIATK